MPTQPHLLLLQKTMVMVEGVASSLDPEINMWETSGPFVEAWLRDELGPEALLAETLTRNVQTFLKLPELVKRLEEQYPPKGAAPPPPPLPDIAPLKFGSFWRNLATLALAGGIGLSLGALLF
jgi:ubiquinone biosynthesis protein